MFFKNKNIQQKIKMEEYVIQTINGKREYCRGKSNQLIQLSSMLEEKYFVNGKHLKVYMSIWNSCYTRSVNGDLQQARKLKLQSIFFMGTNYIHRHPEFSKIWRT